jgi:hypothetical protein
MFGFRTALIGFVALSGMAVTATASDSSVMVIGRAGPGLVVPMRHAVPSHQLVQISTMHRQATGVMVRDDVVGPELIHLQMGNQAVFIDPDRNYRRDYGGGMDSGHSIMRAQRAYHAMNQGGAYVIRRSAQSMMIEHAPIKPRAILLRPDFMERRAPQQAPEAAPTPLIPEVKRGPVAVAK